MPPTVMNKQREIRTRCLAVKEPTAKAGSEIDGSRGGFIECSSLMSCAAKLTHSGY